ncbi:hypothetical protein ACFXGA_27100 [Actinosynnema sp. NPDC059335]|uniref:hypothetical protein n=1 Tax=Actinosynnema sp. NPDC059335 TaxID=3346804 RepID=UPI00366CD91A
MDQGVGDPDRLPASVRMRLGIPHPDNPVATLPTCEPIGVVLGELGERAVRTNTAVTSALGRQDAIGSELAYRCTGVWVVDGLPAVQAHEEILFNLVEDFAPPGRVEQLRTLADRLADDEPALPDGVCDLRVDQPAEALAVAGALPDRAGADLPVATGRGETTRRQPAERCVECDGPRASQRTRMRKPL